MRKIIEQLRHELPPIFAGKSIDDLTGHAIKWNTFKNLKYKPTCPSGLFLKNGRKVLVNRDVFLAWLESQISLVSNETNEPGSNVDHSTSKPIAQEASSARTS